MKLDFYDVYKQVINQNFNFGVCINSSKFYKVAIFENDEMGTVFDEFNKKGYFSLRINKLNLRSEDIF